MHAKTLIVPALVCLATTAVAQSRSFLVLDTTASGICPQGYTLTATSFDSQFVPLDVNSDGSVCTQEVTPTNADGTTSGQPPGGLGLGAGLGGAALVVLLLGGVSSGGSSGGS